MGLHREQTPLKRAGETLANGAGVVCPWNLKDRRGAALVLCFLIVLSSFSLFVLPMELLEPFRMRLGAVAPPTLAFGVTAPMFFLAGERVVALVCFTALRRMSVNGIAIAIVRWLFFVFVLVFAFGRVLVITFVFVGSKEDTSLFLGGVPASFLLQASFHVLSLHQNLTDIFQ